MKFKSSRKKLASFILSTSLLLVFVGSASALKTRCMRCSSNVIDCTSGTCVPYVCPDPSWWDQIYCFFTT